MKRNLRQLMRLLVVSCFVVITPTGDAQTLSVLISPDQLREGDGKTRNVAVQVRDATGGRVNISVSYNADPASPAVDFIPKFAVQDNGADDRDSQTGNIRVILPKAFDQLGVYTIVVEGRSFKLVNERNNSSYFQQLADWLVRAAGGGRRAGFERKSAAERIIEAIKSNGQDKLAIWTAPLPAVGEELKAKSLSVGSAVMPAWSPKGSDLACSAWRNEKWVIAGYTIKENGDGIELWQWNPRKDKSSDFSPAWSPNGAAIAFVRLNENRQSDIWVLELDKNLRPAKEAKVTSFGNVQAVLGWDKDLGLLFETKNGTSQMWAIKPGAAKTAPTPLSDVYSSVRGRAPVRQTLIYAEENDSPPPKAVIVEMNSSKSWNLLIGSFCSYHWPSVSHDEKWLALDSDCPR